jgi:hypothetical protein
MTQAQRILRLFACALLLGACQNADLIRNPLVDRWCGDRPCGWEVAGKIARVGTWHTDDYAVSFESNGARLTQLNATADQRSHCFDFSMIAKVDDHAKLFVELDFDDDGTIDWSERLLPSDFAPKHFFITPPSWYKGVRFIVRKQGTGTAILAKLRAVDGMSCTAVPVVTVGRPLGALCEKAEECKLGLCSSGLCQGCAEDKDCGAGELCAPDWAAYHDVHACAAAGSVAFGAHCGRDVECETGVCCAGACSECCDGSGCAAASSCDYPADEAAAASTGVPVSQPLPKLCAPGDHTRPKGALCTSADDCESGQCDGAGRECLDEPCDAHISLCLGCFNFIVTAGTCS